MDRPAPDYDVWLLDLDGTLVDVEKRYTRRVMGEVGDRLGRGFSPEEAETIWYGLGGDRNAALGRMDIDPGRFWDVFHRVEDPDARADHSFLYDDAAWLGDLDRPVGLVTHSQQYLTDAVLDRLGIRDWFDTVVCCNESLGWKPDPAPVYRALREIGRPATDGGRPPAPARKRETSGRPAASRGVLVGDGSQDVGAAWNAGLDGIHVERHGHDRRGFCVLGDRRVRRLDELLGSSDRS